MNNHGLLTIYITSFPIVCYISNTFIPTTNNFYNNNFFISNNIISIIFFGLCSLNHLFYNCNIYQLGLCVICIKYCIINILFNLSYEQLDLMKRIMWLYTTPVMIHQYSTINNLDIWKDTKLHYHLIPLLITFLPQYSNSITLFIFTCCLSFHFTFSKYKYINLKHTKLFILIWLIYSFLAFIEYFHLLPFIDYINSYLVMNLVGKGAWTLTMNEYNSNQFKVNNLETIRILYRFIKIINSEINKNNSTIEELSMYNNLKNMVKSYIPDNNDFINKILIKTILPYDFDLNYIHNYKKNKKYNSIAILLTDIVEYSGISKENNSEIIFDILNEIYNRFDNVVKKIDQVQKIETIGDAYMIVGDLNNVYNSRNVIEKMIEISYLFIKEIKNINISELLNSNDLQIRIGISIGDVVIGILGNQIPRMSVVGHAVNLASRLQSSTIPDSICISTEVYDIIENKEKYKFTKNTTDLKNIGETVNYTLQFEDLKKCFIGIH